MKLTPPPDETDITMKSELSEYISTTVEGANSKFGEDKYMLKKEAYPNRVTVEQIETNRADEIKDDNCGKNSVKRKFDCIENEVTSEVKVKVKRDDSPEGQKGDFVQDSEMMSVKSVKNECSEKFYVGALTGNNSLPGTSAVPEQICGKFSFSRCVRWKMEVTI